MSTPSYRTALDFNINAQGLYVQVIQLCSGLTISPDVQPLWLVIRSIVTNMNDNIFGLSFATGETYD